MDADMVEVVAATINLDEPNLTYEAEKLITHSKYNRSDSFVNDIALIKVSFVCINKNYNKMKKLCSNSFRESYLKFIIIFFFYRSQNLFSFLIYLNQFYFHAVTKKLKPTLVLWLRDGVVLAV